jgi:hypothetical protein
MPTTIPLPPALANDRWKLKIRDRERLEPPHATVIRGRQSWRWDLRAQRFMDTDPPSSDVPADLVALLHAQHLDLVAAWNGTYPENPVDSQED